MENDKEVFCLLLAGNINKKRCNPSKEYKEPECLGCQYAKNFRIKKRLTKEQIYGIIMMYKNNISCSEISKKFGIQYKKVFDILIKYKVWRYKK